MSIDTTPTAQVTHIDPNALTLETNVRSEAALTPEFISSIKQYGILTPILVQRDETGALRVRSGQRRTLGSIEAGQHTIPAYVVEATGDEGRRIIEQMIENDQRTSLNDTDRAAAFQQLSLIGLTASQIARKTGTKKERVNAALVVVASPTASAALSAHNLTLEEAAVLAEFESDDEAIATLSQTLAEQPEMFAHQVQILRDDRDRALLTADLLASLAEAGVTVIERPAYDDRKAKALTDITDPATEGNGPITPDEHATCPGHAAYLITGWDDPAVRYACTDVTGNGHLARYSNAPATPTPTTPEQAAEQTAERRLVLANNKAWRAAESVRRDWIAGFTKRRTAPKDAAVFIAQALSTVTSAIDKASMQSAHRTACTWLGVADRAALLDLIAKATPARAQVIALALILAAIEDVTDVHTWRHPSTSTRTYFSALARWGYTLSDVEATLTTD